MAGALISSLLSLSTTLLPSIKTSAQVLSTCPSSSSNQSTSTLEMELKKLVRTLKRIQATLLDAEEREIRDEPVKLWLKELKEVAYAADDLLDEFQYEVLRAQAMAGSTASRNSHKRKHLQMTNVGFSFSSGSIPVTISDGIADKIREVRSQFDEIAKDRDALHLREEDGRRRHDPYTCPPPTGYIVDESCIFGREKEKEEVIARLCADGVRDVVSVLPIVGKGGLGKTTLAQLVYMDGRVRGLFNRFGWVSVSEEFDVQRITQSIIELVTHRSCLVEEFSALQGILEKELREKRLFLVLDNVWNEKDSLWELLRAPLLSAERACILVTTRDEPVAKVMKTLTPLQLGYLSENRCWQLFMHYAFGNGEESRKQSNLIKIGQEIMKKMWRVALSC
ncbi:Disease resistance protein RGA2 [Rhynchospora pubera]|uniref:Disease resistance protein RGA2 n=1 Tax=Rhynchospora pubera TaxID=906938 RepID=A0AAV8FBZ6_9POAL|nr:Disease resistance protein RGA2 [Rhynchospora pubera]